MKSKISSNKLSNILAIAANAFGIISLLFLAGNIHNRVNIISILSKQSNGSVGFDAPLQYPLVVSLVLLIVSLMITRRKFSIFQTTGLVLIVTIGLIWAIGLNFALKNTFQP